MLYFDTSFLVPLLIPEPYTAQVERFCENLAEGETLVFSRWGQLEFASVAARLYRMGELSAGDAHACIAQCKQLLARSFRMHTPTARDLDKAEAFIGNFQTRLRTGDALHLAIAGNLGVTTIYTLDTGMLSAGKTMGLDVRGME